MRAGWSTCSRRRPAQESGAGLDLVMSPGRSREGDRVAARKLAAFVAVGGVLMAILRAHRRIMFPSCSPNRHCSGQHRMGADGQRFLLDTIVEAASPIVVVLN